MKKYIGINFLVAIITFILNLVNVYLGAIILDEYSLEIEGVISNYDLINKLLLLASFIYLVVSMIIFSKYDDKKGN